MLWADFTARRSALRPWSRRYLLRRRRLEEIRIDFLVGKGGNVQALLAKFSIGRVIQHRSRLFCCVNPLRKLIFGHGPRLEMHSGKPVSAELCRQAEIFAGII